MANYRENIVDIELNSGTVMRDSLNHTLGSGDYNEDRFGIRAYRNSQAETLTGTVSGYFIRADGFTVPINNGVVSGNKAYITLPKECYEVEGKFTLSIKMTGNNINGTVRIVDGTVVRTSTSSAVNAGNLIQNVENLIQTINEAVESIPEDYSELVESVKVSTGLKALELNFSAGYIKPDTLDIVTSSTGNHQISDPVLIHAMSLLYVPKISKSSNTVLLCECTSTGTPVFATLCGPTAGNSDGSYIIVPVIEDTYFIFGGNTSMSDYMKYFVKSFDKDIVFEGNNYEKWCPFPTELQYVEGPIIDSGTSGGPMYKHTSSFLLMKGMTLEFWDAGSSGNVALSKYNNADYTIISSLIRSTGGIGHQEYTAEESMYVRLSARIAPPTDGFGSVVPEEKFYGWKIYYKPFHIRRLADHPLYMKKLTVMGDSLIRGNSLGPGITWITNLGIKYGMEYTNLGLNGNSVAEQSAETTNSAMVNRINTVPENTQIFVLLGGANDKRLNVPIGEVTDTVKTTFLGALNNIVSSLRSRCPKAHILFMTTYNRFTSRNGQGLGDEDYANAMISAARHNLIPCFDNFHCSGVNFLDENMDAWMDECTNRQKKVDGETQYDDPSHHFGLEGYEWVTPIYEAYIAAASANA